MWKSEGVRKRKAEMIVVTLAHALTSWLYRISVAKNRISYISIYHKPQNSLVKWYTWRVFCLEWKSNIVKWFVDYHFYILLFLMAWKGVDFDDRKSRIDRLWVVVLCNTLDFDVTSSATVKMSFQDESLLYSKDRWKTNFE